MGHAVGWGGGSRSPDSRSPSGAGGHGALASPRVIGTSTHLPQILCIHLKRFRHEVMYSFKISSHVSFPLEGLDLRPFLAKECTSQITTYDLLSVICHHGTAGSESTPAPAPPPPSPPGAPSPPVSPTAGGHYIAYCQNVINGQWYEFDDQYVTEVHETVVQNAEAYVLFYRCSSASAPGPCPATREPSIPHHLHRTSPGCRGAPARALGQGRVMIGGFRKSLLLWLLSGRQETHVVELGFLQWSWWEVMTLEFWQGWWGL